MTDIQKRENLTTNMMYLASNFKSYGVLSRLLACSPKFVSRAITNPHELSLKSTECASVTLGIENKILLGGQTAFKKATSVWLKSQIKKIEDRKQDKKNGRKRRA